MTFNTKVFTGANVFVDGVGLLGILKEFTPPKLENDTVETSTSIGKREIVLPTLKPLSATLVLSDVQPFILQAISNVTLKTFKVKANATADTLATSHTKHELTLAGKAKSTELPKFNQGEELSINFELALALFIYSIDNAPVITYDVENSIYAINGIDQYAQIRANIF